MRKTFNFPTNFKSVKKMYESEYYLKSLLILSKENKFIEKPWPFILKYLLGIFDFKDKAIFYLFYQ